MSRKSRREALLARFRAGSLTRIAEVRTLLQAEAPLSDALLAELHAPLHTLKGEARMLGLASLAALVHQLEDHIVEFSSDAQTLARVRRTVTHIEAMLHAQLVENSEAEQGLATGLALLDGTIGEEPGVEDEEPEGPQPGPKPGGPSPGPMGTSAAFSMVRAELVDELCERLEILRVSFGQALIGGRTSYGREAREALIRGDMVPTRPEGPDLRGRSGRFEQIRHELAELAELAWTLRLVPVEPALDALSEHAERVAAQLGKDLRVRIDAGGAQLERSLLEHLQEPIMHLIHNAVDHGVESVEVRKAAGKPETAKLEISARSIGPEVEFRVIDDGAGIDLDSVRARALERGLIDEATAKTASDDMLLPLLFESGFSTSATVSELSGRGVGLDAVRRAIEGLGGEVFVRSTRGRGTSFSICVPLTISRETVVVVELADTLWGLPSRRVGPVVALAANADVQEPTVVVEEEHVPLVSLAELLGAEARESERVGICCSHGGRRYALSSPPVLGEFDLFRRPLGPLLASVSPATASAVMDDGRLVLLVEPAALLSERGRQSRPELRSSGPTTRARPRVLVVDDSPIVRELLVELLTGAKLDVLTAGDGREALDVLARNQVELVVSDVEMPNVDGFELLRRIRERDRELPVIMVTTRGSVADRERASSLGADAYLVKSDFRDQHMLEAVARFVEISR